MSNFKLRYVFPFVACAIPAFSCWAQFKNDPLEPDEERKLGTIIGNAYSGVAGAGTVFDTMKLLLIATGYWRESDRVAYAVKLVNERVAVLEGRMKAAEDWLRTLQNNDLRQANERRVDRLRDLLLTMKDLAIQLEAKPADWGARITLARRAHLYVDEFRKDEDLWKWSDAAKVRHQRDGRWVEAGDLLPAEFKPVPALEYYTAALVIWMAATDFAGELNRSVVRATFGPELQDHIAFLRTRPGWDELKGNPVTPAEHIESRITSLYIPGKYPENGQCGFSEVIEDRIGKRREAIILTYPAQTKNQLCNVPTGFLNRKPQAEEQMELDYGIALMKVLASQLTRLRDVGTLQRPIAETTPIFPADAMKPKGIPSSIFTISADGTLKWHRHDGTLDGTYLWRDNMDIGNGWRAGFKQIVPDSGGVLYAITNDGTLRWYRYLDYANGGSTWADGPKTIGTGWGDFKQVFSGGEGVLYAVTMNGDLLWYRFLFYKSGDNQPGAWQGPVKVGNGWDSFKHLFTGGKGVIYGVLPDGTLRRHRHTGWKTGQATWTPHRDVGSRWGDYQHVFGAGDGILYAVTLTGDLLWFNDVLHAWDPTKPGRKPVGKSWLGPRKVGDGWQFASVFAVLPQEPAGPR